MVTDPYRQTKMCVSWLCNHVSNWEDTFGLTVLGELLLSGPNSPFYKSLIKPNIGYAYSPTAGYSIDAVQGSFTVGLSSIKDEDIDKVRAIIDDTLKSCVRDGFAKERLEGILHQFEIDQKQRSGTFGLNLLFRMMSLVTHRVYNPSPVQALEIDKMIEDLREKVIGKEDKNGVFIPPTDAKYFENLINKYLLNKDINNRIELIMRGDNQYLSKLEEKEKNELKIIENSLNDDAKGFIVKEAKELEEYQEIEQVEFLIPCPYFFVCLVCLAAVCLSSNKYPATLD